MDLRESNNLSEEEEFRHWWITTRFHYLDRALDALKTEKVRVLEIGCGTGQNLRYLRTHSPHRHRITITHGVDVHMPADFRPPWSATQDSWSQTMPEGQTFDLVLAMDVLEHIEDDATALAQWKTLLSPKGILFMTVPAFESLWSYHDELLHHYRRYRREDLNGLVSRQTGFTTVESMYAFALFFPLVALIRLLRSQTSRPTSTDLQLPWSPLNWLLSFIGRMEATIGGCPLLGTSAIGIYQCR